MGKVLKTPQIMSLSNIVSCGKINVVTLNQLERADKLDCFAVSEQITVLSCLGLERAFSDTTGLNIFVLACRYTCN